MSLSCGCDTDWYPDPGDTYWYGPRDATPLATKRSRRCTSCRGKITPGTLAYEIPRVKVPEGDIEERIWGEDGEIPRASAYMCETCGDIALSLEELGFCLNPWDDQREQLKEYHSDFWKGVRK